MTRRAAAAALLLAFACLVFGFTAGRAAGPASRPTPTFAPVRIPAAVSSQPTPSTPGLILEPLPSTSLVPRPAVEQPVPAPQLVTPKPAVVIPPSTGVRGEASYYDYRFREAAAGAALRVGDWRGRLVTVCAIKCLQVRLTDYMANPARIIDLDDESFTRVCGALTRGVCDVVVSW